MYSLIDGDLIRNNNLLQFAADQSNVQVAALEMLQLLRVRLFRRQKTAVKNTVALTTLFIQGARWLRDTKENNTGLTRKER